MKTRRSKREIASLIVGFGIIANSMRLRKRLSQIPTLDELPYGDLAKNGVLDDWVVISAEGVEINFGTMVVAIEYCRSNSLDAIDLIPSNIPVARAIEFLREYDPIEYRKNPLAEGRGANQSIVISKDAFVRTGLMKSEALDPFDMVQATKRIKQCCATSFISVIAPTLKVSSNLVRSRREWRGIYRDYDSIPLVMRILEVTILVAMSVSRKLLNKFSFASFLLAP
ncbi:MAG: hypothetical protein HKL80_05430 [Acidimicrobiales bacterium]|nr:hypothetical protein [Acidimicrobiales bacterium]